jgi:glycosyltransferase involved in cell wall biosynthesis
MKIIHIIAGDLWAGAEAQLYYTIKDLYKNSKQNLVIILFNEGELHRRLTLEGIKIYVFDENKLSGFQIYKQIKKAIKAHNPDILHVHKYKGQILATLAVATSRNKSKIVRTIHGQTFARFSIGHLISYLILSLEKILLKYRTDCIIAVSRSIKTLFQKKYPKTRIYQLDNTVDLPLDVARSSKEIRNEFNIKKDTFWIGTTARLVPVKNLEMLIQTTKIMKEENGMINTKVSIFGDGHLKQSLQEKIDKYGLRDRLKLHGHYDDILSVMNALDVFTLTSKQEGLPISLLEAMAMGTVPVCTRVGGMKEVIKDRESGFLVELNNSMEFYKILLSLYQNKEKIKNIGNNASLRIKKKYSTEKTTTLLLSLYKTIGLK